MIILSAKMARVKNITLLFVCSLIASVSLAQNDKDPADGLFHDDLLDHFVGQWTVSGTAHGKFFDHMKLDAEWIVNHQYFRIHMQGTEIVPWLGIPMEVWTYTGYNHKAKHYVVHEISVFGADDPNEGFCHAYRTGNELKVIHKFVTTADTVIVQRLIWEPAPGSWHMESRMEISGKEGEPFLDLRAVPMVTTSPTAKKKQPIKSGKQP
ncbi:hypothetical protein SAMN04488109_1490 [Chryseolinea serpens]|uniref:DUF1579 domain-containing protein n=1 Tax=Chryseolinea serpens TaxID=947013 RepID=A0A1M5M081_9BACT|nr:hypothetical protein [Chryseolinea serpens]SHG70636.1 hypothetical protein SAMN04488109_1490 [Chryseolinea serpens]